VVIREQTSAVFVGPV